MIPLAYRTHVVAWKLLQHPRPGRLLTDEEWKGLATLGSPVRFQCGEEIEDGRIFWSYTRNSKDGMFVPTVEGFAKCGEDERARRVRDREKHRQRGRNYYRKNREKVLARTSAYQKQHRERDQPRIERWKAENRDKLRQYYRNAHKSTQQNPAKRILKILRMSLRGRVIGRLKYGRAKDQESVDFLVWLAARLKIDPLRDGYEIDHLIPLRAWDLEVGDSQRLANAPENVQWLTTAENARKNDRLPTVEEMDAHMVLVDEWRASRAVAQAA